jgi:hypothetical protein
MNGNSEINDISNKVDSFGPRPIIPTPLEKGTMFASPTATDGSGDGTEGNPYSIWDAMENLSSGDVLFLRGGVYDDFQFTTDGADDDKHKLRITAGGTATTPTIVESYPNEKAIIDGHLLPDLETANRTNETYGMIGTEQVSHVHIRNIEVRNAPYNGLHVWGGDNVLIEGVESHHNLGNGMSLYQTTDAVVQDSKFHNNYDGGLVSPENNGYRFPYNDGDHSDGIGLSGTLRVTITHNDIYDNADDGIDTYTHGGGDLYTEVSYNRIWNIGKGANGGGSGIKFGVGAKNIAHHNLIWDCHGTMGTAMNVSQGTEATFNYNTAWNNDRAFHTPSDTIAIGNIEFGNTNGNEWFNAVTEQDNSWQIGGTVEVISTDPTSSDFLRPIVGSPFEVVGAYLKTSSE